MPQRQPFQNFARIMLMIILAALFGLGFRGQAQQTWIDSLKFCTELDPLHDSAASVHSRIARKFMMADSTQKALQHFRQAADLYLLQHNYEKFCVQMETIGVLHLLHNNNRAGGSCFFEALTVAEKYAVNRNQQMTLWQNIGIMYTIAEDWERGIGILRRCERFFASDSCIKKRYLIVNEINLGNAYHKINKTDSSWYYYSLALANTKRYNNREFLGGLLLNMGELHNSQQAYGKARAIFHKALTVLKQSKDERNYYRALYGLGFAEAGLNNQPGAMALLNEAVAHFESSKDFLYARDAHKCLCDIYRKQSDWPRLVACQEKYNQANDSLYARDLKRNISVLALEHQFEKTEQENKTRIQLLKHQNQLYQYRWILVLSLFVSLLIAGLALVYRHSTRKKMMDVLLENAHLEQKQLEREIGFRKKEIENMALLIMHKNEFLEQLRNDIKNLRPLAGDEGQQAINSLLHRLTQTLRKNKDYEQLQEHITLVSQEFMHTLTAYYPDLTENEKRLCVLLKLGFNSKEIASLNNVTEDAITKARHRMRKKMELAPEANLSEVIQKL